MANPRTPWSAAALLLVLFPSVARPADERQAARRLAELEQRIDEERASWLEFRKQATSEAERAELAAAFPRDEFVGELSAIAEEAKGTEVAARAWVDVFRLASLLDDRALYAQALERLTSEHVTSAEIPGLTLDLVYGAPSWSAQAAAAALRTILGKNPDPSVQANGIVELALLVGLDDAFGAAGRVEAEALLARIEKEYGPSDFIGMTGKEFAAGARHEITKLRVGQVVPDFDVTDQEGARFKLSDYRGRVVLLDFWGFV